MAAWRYEISLLVLMKYQTIWYWYERRDLLCSRSKGDSEDKFSHVKISSFRANAYLVFNWCLYNKSFSFID